MVISWACMVLTAACQEDRAVAEHPFILWDRRDLESLRLKVETEPWAKEEYRRLLESREPLGDEMRRLFRYAVMGDREAGEAEKKALLALLKAPEPLGGAQEFNVLRYDLLYDRLDPAERAALEKLFRRYIDISIFTNAVFDPAIFNDERRYSRYDAHQLAAQQHLAPQGQRDADGGGAQGSEADPRRVGSLRELEVVLRRIPLRHRILQRGIQQDGIDPRRDAAGLPRPRAPGSRCAATWRASFISGIPKSTWAAAARSIRWSR